MLTWGFPYSRPQPPLRCLSIADGGACWIIRCRRCEAGWLPAKDDDHAASIIIEHALAHAPPPCRAREMHRWIAELEAALLQVHAEINSDVIDPRTPPLESLRNESLLYAAWRRSLGRHLRE